MTNTSSQTVGIILVLCLGLYFNACLTFVFVILAIMTRSLPATLIIMGLGGVYYLVCPPQSEAQVKVKFCQSQCDNEKCIDTCLNEIKDIEV